MLELFATGLFIGYLPKMPGTIASVFTCLVFFLIGSFIKISRIYLILFVIIALLLSFYLLKKYIEKNNITNDSSSIVIDEIIGQSIVFCFIPFNIIFILLALLLFRIFDIFKPLGIRKLEKIQPLYVGIMIDDIVAALYAGILLLTIQKIANILY